MSEENVEIVRKTIEAVNARQVPENLLARDFQLENVNTAVSNKVYVGWAGVREWQDDFFGVMDQEARLEMEEVIGVGTGCVVVMIHLAGHGLMSGAPLELRWPSVCWVRNGRLTRAIGYSNKREALEAAGLSE